MSVEESQIMHHTPLRELQLFQRTWTIKARVIRRGLLEIYDNSKGNGEVWKVILIDDEGTRVQAVMFNDVIRKFDRLLERNKSYFISNGMIKPVNPRYVNVNENIELSLNLHTSITESQTDVVIRDSAFHFVPLNEAIQRQDVKEPPIDTIAFVLKVQTARKVRKENGRPHTTVRQITIRDIESDPIRFTLWGDLAEHEGKILEELIMDKPIIAISKTKCSNFEGQCGLNSLTCTTIEINPPIEQGDQLRERLMSLSKIGDDKLFFSTTTKVTDSTEMTIEQIIREGTSGVQKSFCSFKATIESIDNKREPYYNACNKCYSKVDVKEGEAHCYKCNTSGVDHTERYILKLLVSDGDRTIQLTLFDATEILIGCPAPEFVRLNKEINIQSKFYRKMISCIGKKYVFFTKPKKISEKDRAMGCWIAEHIETTHDFEEGSESNSGSKNKKSRV